MFRGQATLVPLDERNRVIGDSHPSRAAIESSEFALDPYAFYERWRESGDVHRVGSENIHLILGYHAASAALKNTQVFSSSPGLDLSPTLHGADPPRHTSVRKRLSPFFAADQQIARRDTVRRVVGERIEQLRARDRFDAIRDFSGPVAHTITCAWLGLREPEAARIREKEILAVTNADVAKALLPDGLMDRLMRTEGFLPHEVAELAGFFMMAGVETAREFVLFALMALARGANPERFIGEGPEILSQLTVELLRLEPPAHTLVRKTTASTVVGDTEVPEDAVVWISVAAANRDPAVFAEAAKIVLNRKGLRHLSFGAGPHVCLGSFLGQVEGEEILAALIGDAKGIVERSGRPAIHFNGPGGAPSLRQISEWQLSFAADV